jgi:hypothetical protein
MAKMNLGVPRRPAVAGPPLGECGWKLGAMAPVAVAVVVLGFWLPAPLYQLVQHTAHIIGGAP